MKVRFSEEIIASYNISALNESQMEVIIIPGRETEEEDIRFDWQVVTYHQRVLTI